APGGAPDHLETLIPVSRTERRVLGFDRREASHRLAERARERRSEARVERSSPDDEPPRPRLPGGPSQRLGRPFVPRILVRPRRRAAGDERKDPIPERAALVRIDV